MRLAAATALAVACGEVGCTSEAATKCCPGKFFSHGRGTPYPPMLNEPMVAFDFEFYGDDSRLAQRSATSGVDMGSLYLSGVGHFYWTNSTNCKQLGAPAVVQEYFCVGGDDTTWPILMGNVTLPGGTVLQRWSSAVSREHQLWTTQANSSGCVPVVEMGFGVGFGGQEDDGNFFFDHVVGPLPPSAEAAFELPEQCKKLLLPQDAPPAAPRQAQLVK